MKKRESDYGGKTLEYICIKGGRNIFLWFFYILRKNQAFMQYAQNDILVYFKKPFYPPKFWSYPLKMGITCFNFALSPNLSTLSTI